MIVLKGVLSGKVNCGRRYKVKKCGKGNMIGKDCLKGIMVLLVLLIIMLMR
jgi:hypothetical protein